MTWGIATGAKSGTESGTVAMFLGIHISNEASYSDLLYLNDVIFDQYRANSIARHVARGSMKKIYYKMVDDEKKFFFLPEKKAKPKKNIGVLR